MRPGAHEGGLYSRGAAGCSDCARGGWICGSCIAGAGDCGDCGTGDGSVFQEIE